MSYGTVVVINYGLEEDIKSFCKKFIPNNEAYNICYTQMKNVENYWKLNCLISVNKCNNIKDDFIKDHILIGGREKNLLKVNTVKNFFINNNSYYIALLIELPTTYFDSNKEAWVSYPNKNVTFPGGKRQNEDEHPKLSIKREMYEETGIELDNFEYLLNENGSKIIWKNKNGLPMWVFLNKI